MSSQQERYNLILLTKCKESDPQLLPADSPFSLLKIGSKTLLQHQLEIIESLALDVHVTLVVENKADIVKREMEKYSLHIPVSIIENIEGTKEFTHLHALHLAMNAIGKTSYPTLIVDGTVLYDKEIIQGILSDEREDLIAIDTNFPSIADSKLARVIIGDKTIKQISHDIPNSTSGVVIGLYKLSVSSYTNLRKKIEELKEKTKNEDTTAIGITDIINDLLQEGTYQAEVYTWGKYPWCKIASKKDIQVATIVFHKNEDMETIVSKKVFVFDLDGTLILDNQPLHGSKPFLNFLRACNKHVILLSNNSSRGIEETRKKATNILDIAFNDDEVFTSTHATINYLISHDVQRVFAVGTAVFSQDLKQAGFTLCTPSDPSILSNPPDIVVVGFDRELTYQKIKLAALLIQRGIPYILTHGDVVCPTEEGFIPDAGAILELLRASTDTDPSAVLGKPNPFFIELLSNKLYVSPNEIVIVGDRLYTDIRMGINTGCLTILPLSGETTITDLYSSSYLPDYVFVSMEELLKYWKKNNE